MLLAQPAGGTGGHATYPHTKQVCLPAARAGAGFCAQPGNLLFVLSSLLLRQADLGAAARFRVQEFTCSSGWSSIRHAMLEVGDPHVTDWLLMLVGTKPACKPLTGDTKGCEAANRALLIALWLWTEGTKVTPISDVLISVLTASKHVLSFHIPELNGSAAANQPVPGICACITGKPEGLAACYSNKLASPQSGRLSFETGSLCKV